MICLKSLTFVVSITTGGTCEEDDCSCDLLEKSYLCGINNNLIAFHCHSSPCCDLLEKSYLCGINNNWVLCVPLIISVVICLKSLTFVVSITTTVIKRRNKTIVVICLKSLTFVVSITTKRLRKTLENEL